MTTITKPSFPNPSTQQVEGKLDRLKDAVQDARKADGTVDVGQLEDAANGDVALEKGVREIKDAYQRTETRTSSGCSGSGTREVQVDPAKLEASEVQSVMSALMEAKSKVRGLDDNSDGRISKTEAKDADRLSGLSGELAEAALEGSLSSYYSEMSDWRDALNDTASSVRGRKRFDKQLGEAASHHAESVTGADAILWAYRDLSTRGRNADIWDVKGKLENAETSWLRFIPFFGRSVKTRQGHLSDSEVRRHLGCDDLGAFASDKRAAIEARLGGDFAATWLAGSDLPGSEQLDDPEAGALANADPVSSGC
jgi:hypothetical protein